MSLNTSTWHYGQISPKWLKRRTSNSWTSCPMVCYKTIGSRYIPAIVTADDDNTKDKEESAEDVMN